MSINFLLVSCATTPFSRKILISIFALSGAIIGRIFFVGLLNAIPIPFLNVLPVIE
jgi:hypothetical protein